MTAAAAVGVLHQIAAAVLPGVIDAVVIACLLGGAAGVIRWGFRGRR